MAELITITVPDIGDFDSVEIIEVLVSVGDEVALDQSLITLESDKAAMDIPSTHAGVIQELKVKAGDKVKQGSVIATLELAKKTEVKQAVSAQPTPEDEIVKQNTVSSPPPTLQKQIAPASDSAGKAFVHASPSVRQFARELGVKLILVSGSGAKGRITKQDVQSFVKQTLSTEKAVNNGLAIPSVPVIDFDKFGDTDKAELSRIKKISGSHLHACWLNIPHVTQFDEADITDMESFRQDHKDMAAKKGINLTPLVFVMKAVVASLKLYPELNSSLSEDKQHIVIKHYYNLGVAVDTPNGLMVPVIRDVDKKGFLELASELGKISTQARDGALNAQALQGGSFSISSLGGIGGSFFTPIINAPEVAILGVGRHSTQPVWNGSEFVPKLLLPLSLSYDHRVVDGAMGARFITCISQKLSDIRKAML